MPRRSDRPPAAPRRPGPQARGSEPSRRRLFDAAAREFAAHGFAGTSVDRIAAAARLNKAMIYYHFGSKAGLYSEILRDMFRATGDRVRDVAASSVAPEEKVQRFVAAIAEEADARPHFPPIWFREIADGGTHLDPHTIREVAGIVSALIAFIDAGVQRGVFRRVDPFLVHAGIVAPLLLFFASGPLRERMARAGLPVSQYRRSLVVEHIQRVTLGVLRGLAGRPAGAAAPGSPSAGVPKGPKPSGGPNGQRRPIGPANERRVDRRGVRGRPGRAGGRRTGRRSD